MKKLVLVFLFLTMVACGPAVGGYCDGVFVAYSGLWRNLRQIGLTIGMYEDDNRGFTPTLSVIPPEEYGPIIWHQTREAICQVLSASWYTDYNKAWGDPTKLLYASYDLRRGMRLAMVGNPQGSPDWWGPKKRPAGLCMDNMTWLWAHQRFIAYADGFNLILTEMHLKFNKLERPYPYGRQPYKMKKFVIDP